MPIINNGAVSPRACAIPIIEPVRIPGMDSGSTWCVITCIFEAPRPNAASRIEGGTALIAARVAIIIVGKVINDVNEQSRLIRLETELVGLKELRFEISGLFLRIKVSNGRLASFATSRSVRLLLEQSRNSRDLKLLMRSGRHFRFLLLKSSLVTIKEF